MDAWLDEWRRDWAALGALEADQALFASLLDAYREPQRHYHTLQHIAECLSHLSAASALAQRPAELRIALWFHDAIYDPQHADNEARSADWARESLLAAGVPLECAARIHALIMATRHAEAPRTPDEALLLDIDLAVLGADAERFDDYCGQVRAEYAWVPELLFRHKRRQLLEEFLAREPLYRTPYFSRLCEQPARANLQRALALLD